MKNNYENWAIIMLIGFFISFTGSFYFLSRPKGVVKPTTIKYYKAQEIFNEKDGYFIYQYNEEQHLLRRPVSSDLRGANRFIDCGKTMDGGRYVDLCIQKSTDCTIIVERHIYDKDAVTREEEIQKKTDNDLIVMKRLGIVAIIFFVLFIIFLVADGNQEDCEKEDDEPKDNDVQYLEKKWLK